MTAFETLGYTVDDAIATITLNRPDRMNALTAQMANELVAAFDATDADDAVRAVIVTGAGDRAFCAGADIGQGRALFDYSQRQDAHARPVVNDVYLDMGGRVALRIFDSLKPVIGAVNGVAVGFGASILLPMDVRIAADIARFGFVFARRGIVPESASSWFLPRVVGISTALEWCYSGRVFDAGEALAGGLLRSVHDPDQLMAAARAMAHNFIADSAPVSLALTRQMMWKMLTVDHPMEAHRIDSRGVMDRGRSADALEGIAAFREKRKAQFSDRVSVDMPEFFPWWEDRAFE
ncbi:enoyl-CoA hydratase [Sphingobium sp. SCG-1]|uniref:crotonase/enoyl-CoA hydratase family protein n=1 Tax=Sphingobium sp. SCG-1 TaxID=2072936 RepID=UPI000CD6854C|nr:crotonase/enoyl-CoA hydratase family protein [Sphingobium sp. SCG-1]AUW58972.1 enoyl-CoA hydratase [Sphingobium sp. SCG-1]